MGAVTFLTSCLTLTLLMTSCLSQRRPIPNRPVLGQIDPNEPPPPPEPAKATYWVMCSKQLRLGHNYTCSVRILEGSSSVSVRMILKDQQDSKEILLSTPVDIIPGDIQQISLPIPTDLEKPSERYWSNYYSLTIEGTGSEVEFSQSQRVERLDQSMAIFVQTDKGIYKFGQTVKFRVLLTTIDLKPVLNVPADIVIEDPAGNRIWQKLAVLSKNNSGVIDQFSLKIADLAPSGDWKIKVTANGMEEEVTFEVSNYVLPRFEVEVLLPSFGLTYDPLLEVTVKATYTFGKPVTDGFVSLELRKQYMFYSKGRETIAVKGKLNSDGEFKYQFTKNELLRYLNQTRAYFSENLSLDGESFEIKANVTETNTQRTQKGDSSITYYKSPLKMDFMDISQSTYKAGLSYTGYLEFKKQDDTSFTFEELKKISVNITASYERYLIETTTTTTTTPVPDDGKIRKKEDYNWPPYYYRKSEKKNLAIANPIQTVGEKGFIAITLDIPADAFMVTIEAKGLQPFTSVKFWKQLDKAYSPTDSFLQLSLPPTSNSPKVGDSLVIKARSTSPVAELFYQVYAKGLLLMSSSVKPAAPSTDLDINFNIKQSMAPSLRIIAFYRRPENDEFVVDALTLSVDGIFQRPVSVSFSKSPVQPGENVDVIVEAEEDSIVFLASNDKSVNLLKEGNDITQDLIKEFMFSLDYGGIFPYWRNLVFCGGPYYYGGVDASSAFFSAKVLVFTDGLVYRHNRYMPVVDIFGEGDKTTVPGGANKEFAAVDTVRKFFPENWLWQQIPATTDSKGRLVIPTKAPDTITSWVTTVFSMHPTFGLSVGDKPAELITRKDLFVTLDLPLGITQGEDYCFTASVFNYHKQELDVLLTLNKSDKYDNIQVRSRIGSRDVEIVKKQNFVTKYLPHVPQDGVESHMFCITPKAVGDVPIQVQALTEVTSDALQRVIKVKAEGVPRATTTPYLVDVTGGVWRQEIPIQFPADVVPGSQYITFSATGSFLGPVLDNLDDLLRMPYGCGEQNMINFAPTVFLTDYYFKTNNIDDEKLEQAKKYMLAGYTKELTYEHNKLGSYSAFGCKTDCGRKNGSLWLTAFVTKTFAQGEQLNSYQEVFPLDHRVLERSVLWITRQINEEGEFIEHGKVFNSRMQGGSGKGEALTAYTLIALHEANKVFNTSSKVHIQSSTAIKKGRAYLEGKLNFLEDPYDVCIVGYALNLIGSRKNDEAYDLAELLATVGDGLKYWKRASQVGLQDQKYSWSRTEDAISIEATAYCLLMYSERGLDIDSSLPLLRWLTNQRGPQGGFISTQDTVIGLQALTGISSRLFSTQESPLTIKLTYNDASQQVKEEIIKINKASEMLLQKVYVPYMNGNPSSVAIEATSDLGLSGPTPAMVELVLDYNVASGTTTEMYNTMHKIRFNKNGFELRIAISTTDQPASMTILRVEIPAGFSPDMELLQENRQISRSEIKEDNLVLYFDTGMITVNGLTVDVVMDGPATGSLVFAKDKSYTVSNYYQPSEEVTRLYSINENKTFCEKASRFSVCQMIKSPGL